MYFQSVLTDKVHQLLATVRVVPLYQMCGRVAYLCAAFCPILQRFVKSLWILNGFFCTNPVLINKALVCDGGGWGGAGDDCVCACFHRSLYMCVCLYYYNISIPNPRSVQAFFFVFLFQSFCQGWETVHMFSCCLTLLVFQVTLLCGVVYSLPSTARWSTSGRRRTRGTPSLVERWQEPFCPSEVGLWSFV